MQEHFMYVRLCFVNLPKNMNLEGQNPKQLSFAFVLNYPAVLNRILSRLFIWICLCGITFSNVGI